MTKLSIVSALALFLAVALLSCKTAEQKRDDKVNWLISHRYLPTTCSELYPCKDSTGEIVVDTSKSDNKDFSKIIDSINFLYQVAVLQLSADSTAMAKLSTDTSNGFVDRVRIDALTEQIKRLKAEYKPCLPQTITKTQTVYVVDQAKVQSLIGQLNNKDAVILQRDKEIGIRDADLSKQRHSTDKWRLIALCALGAILLYGILRIFIIKRPI